MEDFSFVNAPSETAEKVLKYYSKSKGRPIVTKAHMDEVKVTRSSERERVRSHRRGRARVEDQPYGKDVRLDGSPKPRINEKRKGKKEKSRKRRK